MITRHRARWIALTVAVVLVGFGVVLAVQHRPEASVPRLVQEHKPVPNFDLTTLDSKPISARALAGKTYVVNFWNSWCIPCRQEQPALQRFYAAHRNEPDFAMVGIVRDDDREPDPRVRRRPRRSAGRSRSTRRARPGSASARPGNPRRT